ncbi:hypothetical protein QPL79_07510 [Ignisphaera sp. 4213-co]|uniref:Uncharacterized protein n=1 Tax=Ignisphaera cupida TaxID=3050454 RepID=A0ABD4Z9H0_9CREN|nr:hypothetical protein [Ignisphaera sp. 4213-co]MDK6029208.1 hypothetical protein [Ignisphaera sp. 4213-co]
MPQHLISIKKHEKGFVINFVEFLDSKRSHGVQIRFLSSNTVEIYGFGDGFPSPLNMFQSNGFWHWATVRYDNVEKILKSNISCEDIAYHLYTIASLCKDPVVTNFIQKFVRSYSMHGRVHCINMQIT